MTKSEISPKISQLEKGVNEILGQAKFVNT